MADEDYMVRRGISHHPKLSKENIDKLVDDENYRVRTNIAQHPKLSKDHMDTLINDASLIRASVAQHPNLSKEHMDKLINDKDRDVRNNIKENPSYKKYLQLKGDL